jgi:arylsulfatase A-like enzyme
MAPTAQPRPGFDYWLSFKGQGGYVNPPLNENGREFETTGYVTDLLTDYAVKWLEKPRSKPFCLYLAHKATHADWVPAERHKDLYADVRIPEPASYKDDLSGKPEWQRVHKIRGGQFKRPAPAVIPDHITPPPWDERGSAHVKTLNYYRTLAAADDGVGRVLETLRETGQLDNTVIFFAGDNGFFQGEHGGLGDKRLAYDEAMRIPFLACGPGIPRGKLLDPMVLNVDLAPTLLDMAGVPIPATVQGQSMRPVLAGSTGRWRDAFVYEYYLEKWLPAIPTMTAVRTRDWKYVKYPEIRDLDELYDLKADPIEMHNLATQPAYADQIVRLKAEEKRSRK